MSAKLARRYDSVFKFSSPVKCHNCGKESDGLHHIAALINQKFRQSYVFCDDCKSPENLSDFIRYDERFQQLQLLDYDKFNNKKPRNYSSQDTRFSQEISQEDNSIQLSLF